jgi:hypothetical protein
LTATQAIPRPATHNQAEGAASSFPSSFVKLIVKSRQVIRLFCQVFPNIYLAVSFVINGLRD